MRVAVGGVAPDGFAQPIDRRLGVAAGPVGISEIEKIVRIVGIELRRLGEIVGGLASLRRHCTAPKLHDAKVVEHGRGRSIISQCFKPRERFVVTFQVELRQRGEKLRAAGEGRIGRHWLHRFQRLRMIALLLVYIPQG